MLLGCELPGLMRAARAQALNALVTAQIDTGSINLVSGVRSNLVSDVQSGALLVRALTLPWRPPRVPAGRRCAQRYTGVARPPGRTPACSASLAETRAGARAQNLCKEQGLQLTSVSLASAIYSTPVKPKPDTRPQLAAGIAVAGCIVFAFVGWIIYLESEKTRSCCGYSWCARPPAALRPSARMLCVLQPPGGLPNATGDCGTYALAREAPALRACGHAGCPAWAGLTPRVRVLRRGNKAGLDGKAAQAGKPAKTVAAGHGNTPVATSPHNFDDPPATLAVDGKGEVAMQPQGVATDAPAGTPANGIGRHRLP